MNKLKLLYDVARELKNRDSVCGIFTAEVKQDGASMLTVEKQFDKDFATGRCTGKSHCQFDYQHHGRRHDGCSPDGRHRHCVHGEHHHGWDMHKHGHGHRHGGRSGGFRAVISRLTFGLELLQAIQLNKAADGVICLSLCSHDLSDEIKAVVLERLRLRGRMYGHALCSELHTIDNIEVEFVVTVNAEGVLQAGRINASATIGDAHKAVRRLEAQADIVLNDVRKVQ